MLRAHRHRASQQELLAATEDAAVAGHLPSTASIAQPLQLSGHLLDSLGLL